MAYAHIFIGVGAGTGNVLCHFGGSRAFRVSLLKGVTASLELEICCEVVLFHSGALSVETGLQGVQAGRGCFH